MKNCKKNIRESFKLTTFGFTLVELLAVIVILAIILVIAVPRVMDIINDSKKAALESTTKIIANQAEKQKVQNTILGKNDEITCESVSKLNSVDYDSCDIEFQDDKAVVTINGKGKYENLACQGSVDNVTCQEGKILKGLQCTYDGELVEGAEFIHNQYTYRYKQEYSGSWTNMNIDGWGVTLTDKSSTDPVNTPICSYINGKPLVSTSGMFLWFDGVNINYANATSIDVSEWDTDNVVNMAAMFASINLTEIKGLTNLETNNVTNMSTMFTFSRVTSLDLSNFNTSKVTDMSVMFGGSSVSSLDLSSFNTSKVTDMSFMFSECSAKTIDLSSFNTSNVTNMREMFSYTGVTKLDISSFNTSKVTNMSRMFANTSMSEIKGLNKFNTSKVTSMDSMFSVSNLKTLDLSSFDTSNVENMSLMFFESQATTGYARTQADADKFNDATVTYIPDSLSFTVKTN